MIDDITPPVKNLDTEELLGTDNVSITIDTPKEETQDNNTESFFIPEEEEENLDENIVVAGVFDKIISKTKPKSTIKNIKGEDVPQDDLKDFSTDDLKSSKLKKQKMEEILDERNIPEGDLVKTGPDGSVIIDTAENIDYSAVGQIFKSFNEIPIEKLQAGVDDIFKRLENAKFNDTGEITNLDDLIKFSFSDEIMRQGGHQTIDNATLKQLASDLNVPALYTKIIKRKKGELLGNVESYRAIQESMVMRKLYMDAIEKLKLDPSNPALLNNANKYFRLYGMFVSRISGDISETARKLRTSALARQDFQATGQEEISTILKGIDELNKGNPDDMLAYHKRFLLLPMDKQIDYIQKGGLRKIVDGGVEVFVNTLLASPITHIVNAVSNFGFNSLRYSEQFIAAGLAKMPYYKSYDRIMFNEAMEIMRNVKDMNKVGYQYGKDSVLAGGKAKHSKLDLGGSHAVSTDVLHPSWKNPKHRLKYSMGKMLNAYGHFARLPGTFLVASDEFTKGAIYVVAQKQLARQRYNTVINSGGSTEAAEESYIKVMTNPTVADANWIKEEGLTGTFQGELPPGILKKMQGFLNMPSMKVFVPFYKTVTNIFLEGAKRNPALAVLSKKVRADFLGHNGKRTQTLTHARLLTGSSIMYTFGSMTYGTGAEDEGGFFITGHSPFDKNLRAAHQRKGLQPYSICTKQDAGNYKCRSYARFEPISSLLAIAADTAQALQHPGQWGDADAWDKQATALFVSAVGAIFPYLSDQPFMTIFGDYQRAMNRFQYSDSEDKLDSLVAFLETKVVPAVAGPVINPFGSFGNYLAKMSDPTIYDKGLTHEQITDMRDPDYKIPQYVIAWYEEINKLQQKNPMINKKLPPLLNLWGEVATGAEGNLISPFKVLETKFNKVDDFMMKYGFGIPMPDRKMQGIYLSVEEYQDMIKLMNDPSWDGTGKHEPQLLEALKDMIEDKKFEAAPVGDQITIFKNVVSKYKQMGKHMWFIKHPNIKTKIDEMDKIFKETGQR